MRFRRFEKAWRKTWFDGVHWAPLFTDQAAQQARFERKQLDEFAPVKPRVEEDILMRFQGQMKKVTYFAGNPQAGTYAAQSAPWSDPRLIGAIFRALDRRAVVASILRGQGTISGNIPPPQEAFGVSEKELATFPGYLEDRVSDEAEARAMSDAAGGASLGQVVVDIPDIWEGLHSGGAAIIAGQLTRVLGNDFKPKIEPYTTISNKIVNAEYGNGRANIWYGWAGGLSDPDPTLTLYQTFNSTQPQWKQFGFKSAAIDSLTAEAVSEFDIERRKVLVKEINRDLLTNHGAGIQYTLNQFIPQLFWNYVRHDELSPFVTCQQIAHGWWFDQSDPTWQGRPS